MKESLNEIIKNNNNDVYISDNLLEVLETYNILSQIYKEKINDNDLLILLSNKYFEVQQCESKLYDKLLKIIDKYFEENKKDIKKYNLPKLNCGILIDKLPEKIKKFKKRINEYNGVARTLKIIGVFEIVLGILISIACLFTNTNNVFVAFITILITTFISGMFFVGFSEIIQIGHDIRKNQ